jgi:hypothetical protein
VLAWRLYFSFCSGVFSALRPRHLPGASNH